MPAQALLRRRSRLSAMMRRKADGPWPELWEMIHVDKTTRVGAPTTIVFVFSFP